MSDPFEEEQRRRREQIERVDRERLRELAAEEAKTNPLADAYSDAFQQVQDAIGDRAEMISLAIDHKLTSEWKSGRLSWRDDLAVSAEEVMGRTNYEKWFDLWTRPPIKQDEWIVDIPDDEEIDRRYPRIGGWQAGNNDQTHQALRFEIEAERALFLGKPAPTGDEELAAMHQVLDNLHSTYQRTGNQDLLIAIADQTERYNRALAKRGKA